MDEEEIKKIKKNKWLKTLREENPDTPEYFLELMIDCYLSDPVETEKTIKKHMEEEKNKKNIMV